MVQHIREQRRRIQSNRTLPQYRWLRGEGRREVMAIISEPKCRHVGAFRQQCHQQMPYLFPEASRRRLQAKEAYLDITVTTYYRYEFRQQYPGPMEFTTHIGKLGTHRERCGVRDPSLRHYIYFSSRAQT